MWEFPFAEVVSFGETVRAEEIKLRVPYGRSMSVLLNATPIRSHDGQLASFVVSLQDLTPSAEQERLQVEFLAIVNHELRTPQAAVNGPLPHCWHAAGVGTGAGGRGLAAG